MSLPESPKPKYVRAASLRARFGVSDMWLHRAMRDKGFPRPVMLGGGRDRFWKLDEVEAWEAAQESAVQS